MQIRLKLSKNQVIYEISGQFLTYLRNWFLLSNLISECLHTQIRCTKIFIKFLFQDKKWMRLQYCNFHQYQHIFAVARWNHPYGDQEWRTNLWSQALVGMYVVSLFLCMPIKNTSDIVRRKVTGNKRIWLEKSNVVFQDELELSRANEEGTEEVLNVQHNGTGKSKWWGSSHIGPARGHSLKLKNHVCIQKKILAIGLQSRP